MGKGRGGEGAEVSFKISEANLAMDVACHVVGGAPPGAPVMYQGTLFTKAVVFQVKNNKILKRFSKRFLGVKFKVRSVTIFLSLSPYQISTYKPRNGCRTATVHEHTVLFKDNLPFFYRFFPLFFLCTISTFTSFFSHLTDARRLPLH